MPVVRKGLTGLFYSITKPRVLDYLAKLNRLQWLPPEEHLNRQHRDLHTLLEYTNTFIPYYKNLFQTIGFHPSDFAHNPAVFSDLPFLTKAIIQENFDQLITTDPAKRKNLTRVKTGGTTGEPLWLMYDDNYRAYNTAHVYQEMTWSGWEVGHPQTWLWGHPVLGGKSNLKQVKDWICNRFESNAFHITPQSMEKVARHLLQQPGGVLWSYVSTMYRFAQFLEEHSYRLKLRTAYTAAEPLYPHQRDYIEKILGCKVFNSYSCVEVGSIACECDHHNGLHIRTGNGYVEVLQNNQPVPDGQEGEFVITNLTNFGFPLIRYKVEDWGRKSVQTCPCGRGMPMLEVVEGRVVDHFKTRDGRLVWGAFVIPMVPYLGAIKQYQIVQKSVDLLEFRVIRNGAINLAKFEEIRQAVKTVMGNTVEASLEFVDTLPASPTGKHRYTISEVS
jgi:phenylacetate-CoA ligase